LVSSIVSYAMKAGSTPDTATDGPKISGLSGSTPTAPATLWGLPDCSGFHPREVRDAPEAPSCSSLLP